MSMGDSVSNDYEMLFCLLLFIWGSVTQLVCSNGLFCGVVDFLILYVIFRFWYQELMRKSRLQRHKGVIVRRIKVYSRRWCVPQYIIEYAFKINEGKSSIIAEGYVHQSNQNDDDMIPFPLDLSPYILDYYGRNTYHTRVDGQTE